MSVRKFNDGQEILHEDLSAISTSLMKEVYGNFLFNLSGQVMSGFLDDSFKIIERDERTLQLKAGFGALNGDKKPFFAIENPTIEIPEAEFERRDILVVRPKRVTAVLDYRNFKPVDSDAFEQVEFVLEEDQGFDLEVILGEENAEDFPDVPAGCLLIAELTCLENGAITYEDKRTKLSLNQSLKIDSTFEHFESNTLREIIKEIDSNLHKLKLERIESLLYNNQTDQSILDLSASSADGYRLTILTKRTTEVWERGSINEMVVLRKSDESWLKVKETDEGEDHGVTYSFVDGVLKYSSTDEADSNISAIVKYERI